MTDPIQIKAEGTKKVTLTIDSTNSTHYKFIPEEDGVYYFYSDSDNYVDSYGILWSSTDEYLESDYYGSNGNGNFRITYECKAGETYYISISARNEDSEGKVVTLKVSAIDSTPTIEAEKGKVVTLISDDCIYYKFIPEEDGKYYFYSVSDDYVDSYGKLMDSEEEYLKEDYDSSNGNGNFRIAYECKAGETYYIGVGSWYPKGKVVTLKVSTTDPSPED
jgi:hypothetical protein